MPLDLHDAELRALRFDAPTNCLRVGFAYVTNYYENDSQPSEIVGATVVADSVQSLTIFQLRDPEIVHHAYFLRAGELRDVNALVDRDAVDDAEIRIFPFAEIAFNARAVRVVTGEHAPLVARADGTERQAASRHDLGAFALPRSWPEYSELHSVSMAARPDARDEVVVVLRERSAAGANVSRRYLELHGVGIDLFTAYRLRPPHRITDVLLDASGTRTSVEEIVRGPVESANVYLGFGPSSMLEWRPRLLTARVVEDPADLLDLEGGT